jgi:chromosome partitioning protein
MLTVGLISSKGGVGKTTGAITLGSGLARRGLRVVLVDLDPQGHVAKYLAMPEEAGVYELLVGEKPAGTLLQSVPSEKWAGENAHERGRLAILAGNYRTSAAAHTLAAEGKPAGYLKQTLASLSKGADVVILDTSPTVTTLAVMIYYAVDLVLIPTQAEMLSLHGVTQAVDRVAETQRISQEYHLGLTCSLLGILPTMVRSRTLEHQTNLSALREAYPGMIWDSVPQSTVWPETTAYGKSIFAYAPQSREAKLAERFVSTFQDAALRVMEGQPS